MYTTNSGWRNLVMSVKDLMSQGVEEYILHRQRCRFVVCRNARWGGSRQACPVQLTGVHFSHDLGCLAARAPPANNA